MISSTTPLQGRTTAYNHPLLDRSNSTTSLTTFGTQYHGLPHNQVNNRPVPNRSSSCLTVPKKGAPTRGGVNNSTNVHIHLSPNSLTNNNPVSVSIPHNDTNITIHFHVNENNNFIDKKQSRDYKKDCSNIMRFVYACGYFLGVKKSTCKQFLTQDIRTRLSQTRNWALITLSFVVILAIAFAINPIAVLIAGLLLAAVVAQATARLYAIWTDKRDN